MRMIQYVTEPGHKLTHRNYREIKIYYRDIEKDPGYGHYARGNLWGRRWASEKKKYVNLFQTEQDMPIRGYAFIQNKI